MDLCYQEVGKMDWKACKKSDLVKEVKIDRNLIISLVKSSDNKIKTEKLLAMNDTTASSKVSFRLSQRNVGTVTE